MGQLETESFRFAPAKHTFSKTLGTPWSRHRSTQALDGATSRQVPGVSTHANAPLHSTIYSARPSRRWDWLGSRGDLLQHKTDRIIVTSAVSSVSTSIHNSCRLLLAGNIVSISPAYYSDRTLVRLLLVQNAEKCASWPQAHFWCI